ncbi:hypothetical protein BJ980_003112 [Nocardioides daedukensis]|uniref:DUF2530 domain-containing protein n=1 Tax=Nocardioides daedukensis TaxID=634462 RepID=A0A7Y9S5M5_9ACTN|nr:hypothetical protein [Nocardioides daedukensis]NYG60189.1 hypothetical protein [Nocardioides daedukensis]
MSTPIHDDHSGRHPVNTGHLVMGLAFAGLVAIWAVISSDLVENHDIRWLMPVPWVVAGAVGLGVSAWSSLRHKPAYDVGEAPGFMPPAAADNSDWNTESSTESSTDWGTEPTRTIETDDPNHEENR